MGEKRMRLSWNSLPDDLLNHLLAFVAESRDRSSAALVSKSWYEAEAFSRKRVFIRNCHAVSPEKLIKRFPNISSVTLTGKPLFADYDMVPFIWGTDAHPWVEALAQKYSTTLEELRLKRMVLSDYTLYLLAHTFPNFKVLVLTSCEGFSTEGLATIAAHCRHITELDLQESKIHDGVGDWLSCFPESCTSLVSLNFACLHSAVNFEALERLVARCTHFKSLRLNHLVPLVEIHQLLIRAPQLVDLGTGGCCQEPDFAQYMKLEGALDNWKGLRNLSWFSEVATFYSPPQYYPCSNLTSLDLRNATIRRAGLIDLIICCNKLQCLWVLDYIHDEGLVKVSATCKDLQELRVFPSDHIGRATVTEKGLIAVSEGCSKLTFVLYCCHKMTNAALVTVAENSSLLTCFCLALIARHHVRRRISQIMKPDHVTGQPFDEGFGAIVQHCKSLRRLSMSGVLIRNSPFGDVAHVSGVEKHESMRSLLMSSRNGTLHGWKNFKFEC